MENIMSMSPEELYIKAIKFKDVDDYDNYFIHMTMAANFKHPGAIYHLHEDYHHCTHLKQNHAKTIFFYELTKEFSYSMTYLGSMYDAGIGTEKNHHKASELYIAAIQQVNVIAMNNLASLYETGNGVKQNYSKAIELYSRAIEQEEKQRYPRVRAMYSLAHMYQCGYGIEKNYEKAIELFIRAMEVGSIVAIYGLAQLYAFGLGVTKNYGRAAELCTEAIRLYTREIELRPDSAIAMNDLAIIYSWKFTSEKNYGKAIELYNRAHEILPDSAYIIHNLGYMYENGFGVKRDYAKALEFYAKAVNLEPAHPVMIKSFRSLNREIHFPGSIKQHIKPFENCYNSALKILNSYVQLED